MTLDSLVGLRPTLSDICSWREKKFGDVLLLPNLMMQTAKEQRQLSN